MTKYSHTIHETSGREGAFTASCRPYVLLLLAVACAALLFAFAPWALAQNDTFSVEYFADDGQESIGSIEYKIVKDADGSEPGRVLLTDGTSYHASAADTVLSLGTVTDSSTNLRYKVVGIDRDAFKNNTYLYVVEFENNLSELSQSGGANDYDTPCAVGPYAFSGCTNLKRVAFKGETICGIGDYAFSGCSSLEEVGFIQGAIIEKLGIQQRAFANCSSLKTLRIPAITAAVRRGDSYRTYGATGSRFRSGYGLYWHNNNFCVDTEGLGAEVFAGCSNLESITFEAGNSVGMFAYWKNAGCGLRYLPKLKSVIYEAAQPYFGNPNGSLANQAFVSVWGADVDYSATPADPTFYYAVDYYATEGASQADDAFGSSRLARVEFEQGTPISDIQSSASGLQSHCADAALYAIKNADGTVPDPNQAALAEQAKGTSGFENADAHKWVWMLDSGQSRLSGLADSCKAYLAKADDLSAGRLESTTGEKQFDAMYRAGVQNLSEGSVQNTTFDPERYLNDPSDLTSYRYGEKSLVNLEAGTTPWFTLGGDGLLGLASQMKLCDGAGNVLNLSDGDSFSIVFKEYVVSSKSYKEIDPASDEVKEGPVLMVVQPKEGSGYDTSTCLMEWVLVKAVEGSVVSLFEESASRTWYAALYSNTYNALPQESFDTSKGYATCVSSNDSISALVAASYAGLVKGPINVTSDAEGYGFSMALAGGYYSNGVVNTNNLKSLKRGDRGASSYANACFDVFNNARSTYGAEGYEWGKTALLVHPSYVEEVAGAAASFAYCNAAPVFFTEPNGSVSTDTLDLLKGFESVVILADTTMISRATESSLKTGLGGGVSVTRVAGEAADASGNAVEVPGNAMAFSLAMAQYLATGSSKTAYKSVAVVFASGGDVVADAVGAQNFAGHRGGLTLVASSSADAKAVAQYLRDHRFSLSRVRLFGRSAALASTSDFNSQSTIESTWDDDVTIEKAGAGDSLELYGAYLALGSSNEATLSSRLWGTQRIAAGTYTGLDAGESAFSYHFGGAEDSSGKKVATAPTANNDLTYNGSALVGVAPGTGYSVRGGTATNAGSYTATLTLSKGYTWPDGSTADKKIAWSIEKASLKNAKVKLSSKKMTYTGNKIAPTVKSVTLANGVKLGKSDYTITYKDNVKPGTATVRIEGTKNCTGSIYATFEIVKKTAKEPKKSEGSSSASGNDDDDDDNSGFAASSDGDDDSGVQDTDADSEPEDALDDEPAGAEASALPEGARSEDGWLIFDAPGQQAVAGEASEESVSGPIVPALLIALCLLAMAAAIVYATRFRKETDDLIEGDGLAHS